MSLVINLKADTGLVDRSENTTRFLKDVKDFPTLTREEEIEWFTKYKHGTKEEKEIARDYIMLCNQRMIIAAAKKWAKTDTICKWLRDQIIQRHSMFCQKQQMISCRKTKELQVQMNYLILLP